MKYFLENPTIVECLRIREKLNTTYFGKIFKVPKWLQEIVDSGLAEEMKGLDMSTDQENESQKKENLLKKDLTSDVQKLLLSGCLGRLKKVPEDENDWVNDDDFEFINLEVHIPDSFGESFNNSSPILFTMIAP